MAPTPSVVLPTQHREAGVDLTIGRDFRESLQARWSTEFAHARQRKYNMQTPITQALQRTRRIMQSGLRQKTIRRDAPLGPRSASGPVSAKLIIIPRARYTCTKNAQEAGPERNLTLRTCCTFISKSHQTHSGALTLAFQPSQLNPAPQSLPLTE